jgi:hypothetical protein
MHECLKQPSSSPIVDTMLCKHVCHALGSKLQRNIARSQGGCDCSTARSMQPHRGKVLLLLQVAQHPSAPKPQHATATHV